MLNIIINTFKIFNFLFIIKIYEHLIVCVREINYTSRLYLLDHILWSLSSTKYDLQLLII